MKILLIGEYSNLHWTLAQGLRHLGLDVTVASSGDGFKSYRRDIDLTRKSYGWMDTANYLYLLSKHFRGFKGYDVVQLINPFFLDLKGERNLQAFHYLKKHNGKIFMGAFGDDAYWLKACLNKGIFRYSEFDIPGHSDYTESARQLIQTWSNKDRIRINKEIAMLSDGIIACLYEYYISYKTEFESKLTYIPEPVNTSEMHFRLRGRSTGKLKFFIGIQKRRSEIKGTDVIYNVLKEVQKQFPDDCEVIKAESVPFSQYMPMLDNSDVLLDQLYSYSPGMNALAAMAKGIVVVGGGEPEIYSLLEERNLHPIVNILPTKRDIYDKLVTLIRNRSSITQLSADSRLFIEKHHDYINIANQYIKAWTNT
jgi:hypothetical protein